MPFAQCAQWHTELLPHLSDADLLPRHARQQLTKQARNLYRNLTLALLRRGHDHIHISDEFAASMAKCSLEELSAVRSELSELELLEVRDTYRFPRYKLSSVHAHSATTPNAR